MCNSLSWTLFCGRFHSRLIIWCRAEVTVRWNVDSSVEGKITFKLWRNPKIHPSIFYCCSLTESWEHWSLSQRWVKPRTRYQLTEGPTGEDQLISKIWQQIKYRLSKITQGVSELSYLKEEIDNYKLYFRKGQQHLLQEDLGLSCPCLVIFTIFSTGKK